jgi:hypothetical protein
MSTNYFTLLQPFLIFHNTLVPTTTQDLIHLLLLSFWKKTFLFVSDGYMGSFVTFPCIHVLKPKLVRPSIFLLSTLVSFLRSFQQKNQGSRFQATIFRLYHHYLNLTVFQGENEITTFVFMMNSLIFTKELQFQSYVFKNCCNWDHTHLNKDM